MRAHSASAAVTRNASPSKRFGIDISPSKASDGLRAFAAWALGGCIAFCFTIWLIWNTASQ